VVVHQPRELVFVSGSIPQLGSMVQLGCHCHLACVICHMLDCIWAWGICGQDVGDSWAWGPLGVIKTVIISGTW
jgi:hypothetical protein